MKIEQKVRAFQRRRYAMLFGLGALTVEVCAFLLEIPEALQWPLALVGVTAGVIGFAGYRCPYCGKHPEDEPVALFDPKVCPHCGGAVAA